MGKNLTPNCKSSLPDIVLNWVSQYHCQLVVEEDSLSCGPAKEDQHDVVEESGHQATERPHWRHQTGHHKHHIQTEERHTDVDQNPPMLLPSKSPDFMLKHKGKSSDLCTYKCVYTKLALSLTLSSDKSVEGEVDKTLTQLLRYKIWWQVQVVTEVLQGSSPENS